MRKVLLIVLMVMGVCFANTLCYAKICTKCKESYQKTRVGCMGCNGWRDFTVPHIEKDGHIYTTYRCPHGHEFLVEVK